jgi:hypothetical protein
MEDFEAIVEVQILHQCIFISAICLSKLFFFKDRFCGVWYLDIIFGWASLWERPTDLGFFLADSCLLFFQGLALKNWPITVEFMYTKLCNRYIYIRKLHLCKLHYDISFHWANRARRKTISCRRGQGCRVVRIHRVTPAEASLAFLPSTSEQAALYKHFH